MSPTLPLCCSPRSFNLLARQVPSINSPDALLHGAVAIALHQMEDVDAAGVDATLQRYADTIRSRVRGRQPQALLAHMHEFLFDEMDFRGNTDDYYNPANSYLPAVLESKRGLPITLSLLYKIVAERLGLRAWGVGLPGHFLIGLEMDGAGMLIDTFARGRILTPDEAHERLQEMFGPEVQWSDELLQPASNRHWLTRILQNLLNVFGSTNHFADVAAVLEMEMLLWPEQNHLQRDLGLVLARCGLSQPASIWLDRYLQTNPDDPQKSQIRELLEVLTA
ncbi:MAG TPA: transglutaminase-like domain-containing protein [Tepidisphaeraceae bacterium]|nr:transglutaminase-like domain-containing protein [Tepidisphaeraceae bacterium]